ncbi:MAG: hypothetical protein KDA21_05775, partial [Phycisphaerales bacterium]|nr:hypothetical protein [Phycisphaerales bacterium]
MIADALGHGKRVLFVAEKMAALSVVRRRLEADGLGPWCLELHSAKASKKEVLLQLEAGLRASPGGPPAKWESLCAELAATRHGLNSYVRDMHQPRASGESLYRVLGRLTTLGDGPRINLPMDDPGTVESATLQAWRDHVARLRESAGAVDPVPEHPLRGIGRAQWDFTLPEQAARALADGETALTELARDVGALLADAAPSHDAGTLPRAALRALIEIAALLRTSPTPPRALLFSTDAGARRADLAALVEVGRQRDQRRADLLTRYRQEFLELEHLAHIDVLTRTASLPGPLRALLGFFRTRKYRVYCLGGLPGVAALRDDMESAREVRQMTTRLAGATEAAASLGRAWKNGEADWSGIEALLAWCERFDAACAVLARHAPARDLAQRLAGAACDAARQETLARLGEGACRAWERWGRAWKVIETTLVTSDKQAWPADQDPWLPQASSVLERWRTGVPELDNWCTWRRARDAAAEAGLAHLVAAYECGDAPRDDLSDLFERSFGERWFVALANATETVREFNAATHARTIERFRTIDRALIDLSSRMIAARLKAGAPADVAQASAQSELGILRRELEKKRRHLPTRRLIESMPNLLPRLKPCFLMSPL